MSSLWGSGEVGWFAKGSLGRSGGLLVMWNKKILSPIHSFNGDAFLGICSEFRGKKCYLINVYSFCDLVRKRSMWDHLIALKYKWNDGEWCVAGDFNTVWLSSERVSCSSLQRSQDVSEFNDFISMMELVDLPTVVRKFSWSGGSNGVAIRIDRFLLSDGFINLVFVVSREIGLKDISDHNPVWLKWNALDWGPKPFRSVNGWLEYPGFVVFVENLGML